jgi:hypothetical protein
MNGNTNYLCGADDLSKNNCTVSQYPNLLLFNQASKENILVFAISSYQTSFAILPKAIKKIVYFSNPPILTLVEKRTINDIIIGFGLCNFARMYVQI